MGLFHIKRKILLSGIILLTFLSSLQAQLNTYNLIIQGRKKLATEQYFDAINFFTRIIDIKPSTQEAFFFRGIAKFNLNDFRGAKKDFQTTIRMNPFYSHAYHYLGITEDRIGNYSQAFKHFEKALRLSPFDAYIYLNRGSTYLKLQQIENAINDLDSAIILKNNIPEAYLNLAIAYEEKEDELEALAKVNKALQINPYMGSAYLKRALLKYKRENLEGAYKDIERSQKIDKNNPLAFYYKANILSKQKRFEEALQNYNQVLKYDSENALVFYNRAVLKTEMNNSQGAIDDFTKAIFINPRNILIYFARALSYYEQKEYQLAIADLNTTLEIYPSYPKSFQLRGRIYQEQGKQKRANTDFLSYQRLMENDSLKREYKNDSLLLAKIVDFESDFVNVDKVKDQKVQYKEYDLNLLPDAFFFMRLPQYEYPMYDKIYEMEANNKSYQIVYYLDYPKTNVDSLIEHYSQEDISYFNYFILGTCYGINNDFNMANEMLSKAIALKPSFAYAYVNRAYFNSKLNDYLIDIENRTTQTLSIDGKSGSHQQYYQQIPMIDDQKIIKDLTLATSLSENVMIQYNLGNAYAVKQDFMDAIFWYDKSIQFAPKLKWTYFNKALIQIRLHDEKAACKSLSKAGELGLENAYPVMHKFCKD